MPLALTWTSALGSAPYRDCTARVDADGRSYWAEVVTFDDGVDVSLWALASRGQVRRSRDVKIRRDACKDLRRTIAAAYRERIKGREIPYPSPGSGETASVCNQGDKVVQLEPPSTQGGERIAEARAPP